MLAYRDFFPDAISSDQSFRKVRWLFLRGLAVVVFFAFLSLFFQITGLIGQNGIIPIASSLEQASVESKLYGFLDYPTLVWWFNSDAELVGLTCVGMGLAVLLFFDVFPKLILFLLWVVYLSLIYAGRIFMTYQWDILISETLFLSILFAPATIKPFSDRHQPSLFSLFLMRLLLFKLMFLGGIAKLLSQDPTWWNLTALDYHFLTQPIPTPAAWVVDKLPSYILMAGTLFTFLAELVAPIFLFFGRRIRHVAVGFIAFLQVLIALTGNYGTFNFMSLLLCLVALDDRLIKGGLSTFAGGKIFGNFPGNIRSVGPLRRWCERGMVSVMVIVNVMVILTGMGLRPGLPGGKQVMQMVQKYRVSNSYGLFADMTTKRREIVVQGSRDGRTWKSYRFPYKPGDESRRPPLVAPHMPRLDWQMWFAALKPPNRVRWFPSFLKRLLQGSDPVLGLMRKNPFPDNPPTYLRALMYRYEFSTWSEFIENGRWWSKSKRRMYFPAVTIRQGELRRVGR